METEKEVLQKSKEHQEMVFEWQTSSLEITLHHRLKDTCSNVVGIGLGFCFSFFFLIYYWTSWTVQPNDLCKAQGENLPIVIM